MSVNRFNDWTRGLRSRDVTLRVFSDGVTLAFRDRQVLHFTSLEAFVDWAGRMEHFLSAVRIQHRFLSGGDATS